VRDYKAESISETLLANRGIKTQKQKKEFFNPTHPNKLTLKGVGINSKEVNKAILRIKKAAKKEEMIVVYGDYDVDGICGTGTLFETLFLLTKQVHPHLPERFSEGYGLNPKSVVQLKSIHPNLGLIITVDNGISAFSGVEKARQLGIDVVLLDHHQKKQKTPKAYACVYTKEIGGSEIAWIFCREVRRKLKIKDSALKRGDGLELAALGTIADMLPLIGPNRSFAWHGIKALRQTVRPGLLALFEQAGISKETIGPYEINYMISPRLNAAGRLEHAIDSLRLICTSSPQRARELAQHLGRVNARRQGVQEEIVLHARASVEKFSKSKVLVLAHESYHEGVVGLAAAKLAEEFGRPTVVFWKGEEISKGSARSIPGFDLVGALSKVEDLLLSWGGHKAAAGLSIQTAKIEAFSKEFARVSAPLLTDDILTRSLKIDVEIGFGGLTSQLLEIIKSFEPTGAGNPTPVFTTREVNVVDARAVGVGGKHLKLRLSQEGNEFGAIAFSQAESFSKLSPEKKIDIVYTFSENTWNSQTNMDLKIKDLKPTS
jgi:single-stranded-DNA-specific exonuclease